VTGYKPKTALSAWVFKSKLFALKFGELLGYVPTLPPVQNSNARTTIIHAYFVNCQNNN